MPRPFPLECGITLQIEYVPAVYARSEAAKRFPEPPKPTARVEIARDVFDERSVQTADYLRELAYYNEHVWPIALRAALIDMSVLDESLPPIDQALLAKRRARIPKHWHFGDKSDWIMMCLIKGTYGPGSELEALIEQILENDFSFAEVEAAARALKSDG